MTTQASKVDKSAHSHINTHTHTHTRNKVSVSAQMYVLYIVCVCVFVYATIIHNRNFRSHSQSVRVLPANERGQLRWNADPFLLDSAGSSSEMDPGAWLMPYWLARWTKLL